MSKGSPVRSVRLPEWLLRIVEQQIASRNQSTADAEYGVSGFIAAAIEEKLLKMARSRESGEKRGSYRPRAGLLAFNQLKALFGLEAAEVVNLAEPLADIIDRAEAD